MCYIREFIQSKFSNKDSTALLQKTKSNPQNQQDKGLSHQIQLSTRL